MNVDGNGIQILGGRKRTQDSRTQTQPATLKFVHLTEQDLFRRQAGKCFYCFQPMFPAPHSAKYPTGWTRDHFFPKEAGNELTSNTVLAHKDCNYHKNNDAPTAKEMKRFKALYLGNNLTEIFGKGAQK